VKSHLIKSLACVGLAAGLATAPAGAAPALSAAQPAGENVDSSAMQLGEPVGTMGTVLLLIFVPIVLWGLYEVLLKENDEPDRPASP